MKENHKSSSRWGYLPFILTGLTVVAIAAATVIEDIHGSETARRLIYGALWFKLLWAAIAVAGGYWLYVRRLWRRFPVFMLHLSFIIILLGALMTSLTGKKGTIHLRQGIPAKEYINSEWHSVEKLPFYVRLDSFKIAYYPGTEAPQDYISQVTMEDQSYTISMNHIARLKGYRFFQSSFDEDMLGSVLSLNYDPFGTPVTYLGYALLGLSMMWVLLASRKRLLMVALLVGFSFSVKALPVVPVEKAAAMEREQVVWNGRIAPMGTMAQELLLKLYGKRSYHGLNATQVVSSMLLEPRAWSEEPIIKVKRGSYKTLSDFVDYTGDVPRLQNMGKDPKTDEKVGLILMLMQGTLVKTPSADAAPLSEKRVSAELLYNHVDWTLWAMIACFLLAILAGMREQVRPKDPASNICAKAFKILLDPGCGDSTPRSSLALGLYVPLLLVLLFLLAGWCLRWYISGFIPLSNGFETMYFVAMCLLAVPFFARRTLFISVFSAAFVLLVSHLGEVNPRITPLMPVLHSPWLSAHVSIIMMSYALLVLSIVERRLLRLAVFFLAAGIFLGAIWANVSWGTYWSWDPKESWALITLLVYSVPLHSESLPWFRSMRNYRIYSLMALCCLLMTYFGVNYLLGGMHSYAN
ncbi:MAG: cytochrome c biogenesis protein CcsA [Bacteroidaceae bacterium]|nr:cytochrome c biogenesis protein CcsA [Bacteroidaceae bacterium]